MGGACELIKSGEVSAIDLHEARILPSSLFF